MRLLRAFAAVAALGLSAGIAHAQSSSVGPTVGVCAGDLSGAYPNCVVGTVNGGISPAATMYASRCVSVVNTSAQTSTFCPVATDPASATKRTYPANSLTVGKAFTLNGGGIFTVPAANTLSAEIRIKVGSAEVMSVTTGAAPVATNAGVDFHAACTVRTTTTINCNGMFAFVVLGGTFVPVPFNQTSTFDPTVANTIDVLGNWNGTTSTHSTTVTEAILTAMN